MNLEYSEEEYLGKISEEDEDILNVNEKVTAFDNEGYVGSVYEFDIDLGEDAFSEEDISTLDDIFSKGV